MLSLSPESLKRFVTNKILNQQGAQPVQEEKKKGGLADNPFFEMLICNFEKDVREMV